MTWIGCMHESQSRPARHGKGIRRTAAGALIAVGLLIALPVDSSAQCLMCKTAFDSPEGRALTGAYRRGILLMLATSSLAAGVVAGIAIRSQRRLRRHLSEQAPPAAEPGSTGATA